MADRYFAQRLLYATLGLVIAALTNAPLTHAQYTFVQDSDNAGLWDDSAMWTGGPVGTYPNAVGGTVLINAPTTTSATVGTGNAGYKFDLPSTDVTIGELKIDNTSYDNHFRTDFRYTGGKLIFHSTSGPAKYTETIGSAPGITNSQYRFFTPIDVLSDLVITQDNYPNLNTGTIFAELISGASSRTITKEGHGGIQLEKTAILELGEIPFLGQFVINQGGIRLLDPSPISNAAGITVNSGGQLMLADNAQHTGNTNWNLAPGAVLNLNGLGKATDSPQTVINPDGALRFNLAQNVGGSSNFNNPVVLQTDSVISVIPDGTDFNTGVLTGVVSGAGGLTKHGAGTLLLSNTGNSYDGDTTVLGGTLSIASAFLSDMADVYLTAGGVFNLNFSGDNMIRSLYIDGVPQPLGTYGSSTPGGVISGSGTLTVTAVPGLTGDHNNDGVVDAADYVAWRKDPGNFGGDPAGYNDWKTHFGEGGPGSGNNAPVPEPTTCFSLLIAAALISLCRRK